ncbi:hypothetical protein Tco_0997798 [Tanacetum coccineum]
MIKKRSSTYLFDVINYDDALNIEKGLNERVEELEGEKKGLEDTNLRQADQIKQLEDELKKSKENAHQLRVDREKLAVECGNGEIVSLAVGKGFIDGISIGKKDEDVQAILVETPNVDPAASASFMEKYEELFEKRYPYVDKVTSAYLHDPSGLQNVMRDETDPTHGQGPHTSPTVSIS